VPIAESAESIGLGCLQKSDIQLIAKLDVYYSAKSLEYFVEGEKQFKGIGHYVKLGERIWGEAYLLCAAARRAGKPRS
jgi:hypothetical protein